MPFRPAYPTGSRFKGASSTNFISGLIDCGLIGWLASLLVIVNLLPRGAMRCTRRPPPLSTRPWESP